MRADTITEFIFVNWIKSVIFVLYPVLLVSLPHLSSFIIIIMIFIFLFVRLDTRPQKYRFLIHEKGQLVFYTLE